MNDTIQTTRFGNVKINQDHLIEFRDGMIGFPKLKRYVLIESPSMPLLLWLQSIDDPAVAFPLAEPWFFKANYQIPLNSADQHTIEYRDEDRIKEFVVLTIPKDLSKMTANMKAPVLINIDKALGGQCILQDKTLQVRIPAWDSFQSAQAQVEMHHSSDEEISDDWNAVEIRRSVTLGDEIGL